MEVNMIELLNVVVVFFLLGVVFFSKKKNLIALVLVYGSTCFLYAVIPLISGASNIYLAKLHVRGGGILVKLATVMFLLVIFVSLAIRVRKNIVSDRPTLIYFGVAIAAVIIGYIHNVRVGDWLQLQNILSVVAMLVLMYLGHLWFSVEGYHWSITKNSIGCANAFLAMAVCVGFYEICSKRAWAYTVENSGEVVWRASSILFNPNLFAYWCSMVYLGCVYGMYCFSEHRRAMMLGMVLSSLGIYSTASRGVVLLLISVLLISSLLLKSSKKLRWLPLMLLPFVFFVAFSAARFLQSQDHTNESSWHSFVVIGERLARAPLSIANYIYNFTKYNITDSATSSITSATSSITSANLSISHPSKINESIEGRFRGKRKDAGFLALYDDAGILGLAAVVFLWGVLATRGFRRYMAVRDISSVYALAFLMLCFFVGFAMRFQVFPLWLFIGGAISVCMSYWRDDFTEINV
ncbi:hypothetical protein [Thiovibrio frasassiensis]|uniref:Uncharacterized protein n=1 Tax=Thiovibrio frasassiensis TaxID=2984131 RepID=A0A9X4RLF3_9BACT|nr:hypothetical protein [Thiovibrio frasassiensis]MDG4476046.1 hypothetical protein [Thiovibrio frasassiensis]